MTAQFAEQLVFKGQQHAMCTQPLIGYQHQDGTRSKAGCLVQSQH